MPHEQLLDQFNFRILAILIWAGHVFVVAADVVVADVVVGYVNVVVVSVSAVAAVACVAAAVGHDNIVVAIAVVAATDCSASVGTISITISTISPAGKRVVTV